MTAFSALAPGSRTLLTELLFLAAMGQLALCLCRRFGLGRRGTGDEAAFLLLLPALSYTAAACGPEGLAAPFPWALLPLTAALLLVHAVLGLRRIGRAARETLTEASVKEALDDLNTGLCFADATGRLVLVNRVMGELVGSLTGSYPQTAEDIAEALEGRVNGDGLCRFPDGRVWRFRSDALEEPDLRGFTQTTAEEVTAIAEANERLRGENEALRAANEDLRRMYDRLSDRVREQETLRLKMRVHNEIGASLIALSELMEKAEPAEETAVEAQLRTLRNAVSYLAPPPEDELAAVRDQAAALGAVLTVAGDLPAEPWARSLVLAAARECLTNCVRHAGGDRVFLRLRETEAGWMAVFTNAGSPPAGPIAEGGGLSGLRKSVERAGGEMRLSHAPRFSLTLILPRKETEE